MIKRYLAISTWVDKDTGVPKTTLAELSEGTGKNGKLYQISDTKSTMMIDESHPAGTILSYTMTMNAPENSGKAPQEQRSVKINQQ